jgi:hypothetical protein
MTIERPMFPPRAESVDSFSIQPSIGQPESIKLTSEPKRPVSGLSRRLMLAGLAILPAGLPAAAAPTVVVSASSMDEDPAFALIRAKREADVLYSWAIDALDAAEEWQGPSSDAARKADERCYAASKAVNEIDWKLATTPPTTLAGVVAVLRLANLIEDGGMEWPNTDTVGSAGWHYQLRATMAAAIEAIIHKGVA